jgi:nucleoside-diphosphate kinase
VIVGLATSAKRELDYFFGAYTSLSSKGILNNCSCLVIKPHAVKSGRAGQIIDCILEEGN